MTRKDYKRIAACFYVEIAIADAMQEPIGAAALRSFAAALCQPLHDDNPRFDRTKFLAAAIPPTTERV